MTFRTCLRKVFKIYKNGLESKLDDELSRNESQIETYFDSVCISKGFMVLYAIDHSVLRVRYWRPAEIASKGPARKANCGAKEKAITEFFQILYTEQ